MIPFRGNINGTVDYPAGSLPLTIDYFSLVPTEAGGAVANVYLINDTDYINICPANLPISFGEMYEGTGQLVKLATDIIRIQSSANIAYNFTLNNIPNEWNNPKK